MPVTDGQLFVYETGDSVAAADLMEIQAGSTPLTVGGQTTPLQRPLVRSYLDRQAPAVPFQKFYSQSFTTELKGTAGTPSADTYLPEVDKLLRASGLTYALNGALHEYTWTANPNASAAVYTVDVRWEELGGGNYYISTDCNYSFTLTGSADALPTAAWTGSGSYAVPVVVSSLTADTANAGVPIVPITTYTIAGLTSGVVIRDWTINSGLSLTQRNDVAGGNGYTFPNILGRSEPCTVTVNVEAVDETTKDYFGRWAAGTVADLELKLAAGSRSIEFKLNDVAFDAPVVAQGTPNMYTLTGAASSGADNATSSLQVIFG